MRYTDDETKVEDAAWKAAREIAASANGAVTAERVLEIATLEFAAALLKQFGSGQAQRITANLRNAADMVEKWTGSV